MKNRTIRLFGVLLTFAFLSMNLSVMTACKPTKSSKSKFNKGLGKRVNKAKKQHKFD